MIYNLALNFASEYSFLNVFKYITFITCGYYYFFKFIQKIEISNSGFINIFFKKKYLIHGLINNYSLKKCGELGSICAGQIITQLGSRSNIDL